VKKAQPHPITHCELQVTMASVIVLLGQLLLLEEPSLDLSEGLAVVTEQAIDGVGPRRPDPVSELGRRRATVVHLEWCCA